MEHKIYLFNNGLRLVYTFHPGQVSHCALMIRAGGRDEPSGEAGVAHFIEHMLFKGTSKRKSYQIINRLEIVGGELNAYTTKEETCVHASMLPGHFERAAELISDIVFNSVFPLREIEKEKEVILDEINSYQDNPAEQIYDDFECMLFRGQPLGNPVLGTPHSVKQLNRKNLLNFVGRNYTTGRMVFSYSGSIPFDDVINIVGKYFGDHKRGDKPPLIRKRVSNVAKSSKVNRKASHVHFISGNTAYSGLSPRRFPLFLMNNILGGPGMNSRLNMNIREKFGYTYHVESAYVTYRDTGMFHVYFACERKFFDKCVQLVESEFKKLRDHAISGNWLTRYKYQLKGQIAIAQENNNAVMLNNARSVLHYNKPVDVQKVFNKIDAISASSILEVANEILDRNMLSSLMYDPEKD